MASSPQLRERGYWVDLMHPELGRVIRYPGSCIRSSETGTGPRRRAPLIGEHNEEVYAELGLTKQDLVVLRQAGVI